MFLWEGVQYFTEKEISSKYGFSLHRLRHWRYGNNGPRYFKLNKKIFYTMEEIDKWLTNELKMVDKIIKNN